MCSTAYRMRSPPLRGLGGFWCGRVQGMKCQNMATDSYGNDASANFWHSATGIEVQEESGFRWIQAHKS